MRDQDEIRRRQAAALASDGEFPEAPAYALGTPTPGVRAADRRIDPASAESVLPTDEETARREEEQDYNRASSLSRGLKLFSGAATLGLSAAMPSAGHVIAPIGAGLMQASNAPRAWNAQDREFKDGQEAKQAKAKQARQEQETQAWKRFMGEREADQGDRALGIKEQDLEADRLHRQEQRALSLGAEHREQAEFAYAEGRRDPNSRDSRAAQETLRAARDAIGPTSRNPGLRESLTDDTINGLSLEQIEKNPMLKELLDAGQIMTRRGGRGAGTGTPGQAPQRTEQEQTLLQRMAEERAALTGKTVEEELATVQAQWDIAGQTEGGTTQRTKMVNDHFGRRERTNMGTDQDELEAERVASVQGWDREPNAPQLSAQEANEIRDINVIVAKVTPKLERLEEISKQLNWVDHTAPNNALGSGMVAVAGNTELRNEAIQLSNDITSELRKMHHMGVPQQFEMSYTERGIPTPDSVRGGIELAAAARNMRQSLARDRDSIMTAYGYRRAEGGGGNRQSRNVAPASRINRTAPGTSTRRTAAAQAPAANMSPPPDSGPRQVTVRRISDGATAPMTLEPGEALPPGFEVVQ